MKLFNNIFKVLLSVLIVTTICNSCYAGFAEDAKVEYNKGIDFYQLGQYEKAAESFKNAIDLDPNYIDAYYNLGSILEYLNKNEDALTAFKQIILRKPDDYEAVYKAAEISKNLGDVDKAKMYLTLIPQDSILGQRAKQLANSLEVDLPTIKEETNAPESFSHANPQVISNGIYENIASPTGIVTDKSGNLYVAGFSDNVIYKITPDNTKIVYIKNAQIDGPIGLERDESGNLYVANYNKNNVLKIEPNGKISVIIENILNPYCMHVVDNLLFVSSQGGNSVIRYKLD